MKVDGHVLTSPIWPEPIHVDAPPPMALLLELHTDSSGCDRAANLNIALLRVQTYFTWLYTFYFSVMGLTKLL